MVFFESPHRLAGSLHDLAEAFGPDRPAAVVREISKLHEEARRGSLAELAAWAEQGVRGEICIVVAGLVPEPADIGSATREVQALVASGERLSHAAARVAAKRGLSRRELYEAVLRSRPEGE